MKALAVILVGLLGLLQYTLWLGEGGLMEVHRLERALERQKAENEALRERNARLEAEVVDLKEGIEAIEARARRELGMIRSDETFYQIVDE